jgi:hypothetical protein
MANVQRIYNIEEFAQKARAALKKLEQEKKPGQAVSGGKKEVIRAVKGEIQALLDKNYTPQQIAEAFKQDVFGILPKTITELIEARKHPSKRTGKSKGNASTVKAATKGPVGTPGSTPKKQGTSESKAGSFAVKPDREDI